MKQLKFNNGKFRIMQIADIQENATVNSDTIKLIRLALEKAKPDLVVLTGDQIQGYSSCYLKGAEAKVKKVIDTFIEPMASKNIPFCVTFGNHDDDCKVSKKLQMAHYTSYENCVYSEALKEDEPGTFAVTVKDSENKNDVLALYFFDTNNMHLGGACPPVSSQQLQWYQNKRDSFRNQQGDYLPGIVFQHIPLPEYFNIIEKVGFFTKGRVEGYKSHRNTFYRLDSEALKNKGFMYEAPATPDENSGQFDVLREKGDIFAVYVGHDHNNSFYKNYKGIDLGYCQGAGFNTYGPGDKRGVRIFDFEESNVRGYTTHTLTMGELCDFKPSAPFKEFIFTHSPVSPDQAITDISRVLGLTAATVLTFKAVKKLIKR